MSSLSKLAQQIFDLREKKSEITNSLNTVKKELEEIEQEMLEELAEEGMNRIDLAGKASFFIATRKFYRIDNRDDFMRFLEEQGDEDILTVQHQTLNAYAKEIATRKEADGDDEFEIPGLVFHAKSQIRVKKLKN